MLFLQGGASTQFSAIPMNLIGKTGKADYAVTGNFSNIAYEEAQKYGKINLAASSADRNHTYIPTQQLELKLDPEASYFYYCANNTIYGTESAVRPRNRWPCPCVCRYVLGHFVRAVWWMCPNIGIDLRRRSEEPGACRSDHRHRQRRLWPVTTCRIPR